MYLPSPRDNVDAIILSQAHSHLFPFHIGKAVNTSLLLLGTKSPLKLLGFSGAEFVTTPNHVGSVCVIGGIERGDEGEHFGCVPAATEDNEKVGWCTAFAWRWTAAVEGWEDVDETEL